MAKPYAETDSPPTGAAPSAARRVLTISADMGGGHNATAAGLEEAAREIWSGSEIRRLDILDLLGPGVGNLFRRIYVTNVEKTPWLYEFFYSSLWRHRWFATASKNFTGAWCAQRLAVQIDKFDPDLILSTYPLATSGLAWLRRHRGLTVPCAAWVSDFAPHPFWIYRDIDANFIMHEVALAHAQAADPGAHIEVCTPPVVRAFAPGDRYEARQKLGLRHDAFVVLVTCGAYAFGDVAATVRALLEAAPEVQVVAACGRNAISRAKLDELGESPQRLVALGWTDSMADYVRSADVVLTNAGGASALEALACGRPVLMCRPIAAHGAANAQLMVVSGLADICSNEERLVEYIRTMVADRESLEALERRSREHRKSQDLHGALTFLTRPRERALQPGRPWPMRSADEFFSHVEFGGVRQEIGAVLTLDPLAAGQALDVQTLRQVLAGRAPGLPPLHRVLARGRRLGWFLTEQLDVTEHVHERVLAPEATESDVSDAVDAFWSRPMPEDRPAWQMLLVRGQSSGAAVLAVKMHHAHGDGVSALGLLDRLLTAETGDKLRERGSGAPSTRRPTLASAVQQVSLRARGLWSLASRGRPPQHPLNQQLSASDVRRFVRVPLPAAHLRAAARALHAQPHELVLSILAAGLGRVLEDAGLLSGAKSLRVMVPIAMRSPRLDRIFGNWTGAAALDLPVGPMTPAQRVAAVQSELRRRIRSGEPEAAELAMRVAGTLPSALHGRFARLVYTRRFFNLIVSYMPGARGPRWCAGARVSATYPVLPLTAGVPLSIGAVLADGTVGVGVFFDPVLKLDRAAVAAAVVAAFEEAVTGTAVPDTPASKAGRKNVAYPKRDEENAAVTLLSGASPADSGAG